jgi:RNA polymerase sigma factor (sigma-70 family)
MGKRKVIIRVNEKNEVEILSQEGVMGLTLDEKKKEFLFVRKYYFNQLVEKERKNVLLKLGVMFGGLRFENLEEVYDDGCLVLWGKMMDKEFKLKEKSMVGYLVRVCRNIGMHYLRKVNEDIESLDRIMKRGYEVREDDERGIEEIFDVMDERGNEDERYEKLDRIWIKLKEVDRMILESYYVDGCKMEEIAKKIGYRNGNSVKSKKNKVLRRMIEMMKENEADFKNLPLAA